MDGTAKAKQNCAEGTPREGRLRRVSLFALARKTNIYLFLKKWSIFTPGLKDAHFYVIFRARKRTESAGPEKVRPEGGDIELNDIPAPRSDPSSLPGMSSPQPLFSKTI